MKKPALLLLLGSLIFSPGAAVAAVWGNISGYSVSVNGQQKAFYYSDWQTSGQGAWDYSVSKLWGWSGSGGAFGNSYVVWKAVNSLQADEALYNSGGFPEYSTSAPWLLKVRRPPGLRVYIPKGTGTLSFSGTFSVTQPTVPPSDHYMSGQQVGLNLGQPVSPLGDYGTEISEEEYTELGRGRVEVAYAKPALVVVAEDNSWSWHSPIDSKDLTTDTAVLQRVGDMFGSGLTGSRALVSLVIPEGDKSHSLVCAVPVPWGWSGNVKIFFTGFVAQWHGVTPTKREGRWEAGNWLAASWWRRDHHGVGMLPMSAAGAEFTVQPRPLVGTVSAPGYISKGTTAGIPIKFDLRR